MRPHTTCFILSILLLAVVALPLPNPRSWKTYGIIKIVTGYPPFPPPDIGPLNLPRDFFDDFPDLKSDQIASIKKKNFEYHTRHQKEIERLWRERGERPTDEELKERARDIRETIRKACKKELKKARDATHVSRRLSKSPAQIRQLGREIEEKTRLLQDQRRQYLEIIRESEQTRQDAEVVFADHREQMRKMIPEKLRLARQLQGLEKDSQKYIQIEQELKQQDARLDQVYKRYREAELAAQRARQGVGLAEDRLQEMKRIETDIRKLLVDLETAKKAGCRSDDRIGWVNSIIEAELIAQIARKRIEELAALTEGRLQEQTEQIEADIRKLTEQLAAARKASPGSGPNADDQTENENNFSMTSLGNGARRWMQGVGGFIQDVNRRVSAQSGDIHPGPLHAAPLKPGLLRIP